MSLANILHRSKYSLDAAILMHAALETTSDFDIIYFTLGNIYGVSIVCYLFVIQNPVIFIAFKILRLNTSLKLVSAIFYQISQDIKQNLLLSSYLDS